MLVRTGFILSSRSVALGKNSDLIINVVVQLLYSHLLYLCIFSEVDCIYEKKNHFFIDQTRFGRSTLVKFLFSEKATKIDEIFTVDWTTY